jgi:ribosomal-protein-alanine N-acetyltransferase
MTSVVAQTESNYRLVEGELTLLRPAVWGFSEDELRRRYRWSHDDVLQYWSGSIPNGRTFRHFVDTLRQRDWPDDGRRISYAILKRDEELAGMVSCYNIDREHHIGEIGIYLGEKDLWGHGLGTDALVTFVAHLFHDLGFESVYLHTYQSNIRAQRSYARVGFESREVKRRYAPRVGYHDEVRMELSLNRFAQTKGLEEHAAGQAR